MKVFCMFFMVGTTSESLVFSEGSHHYAVRSKLINLLPVIQLPFVSLSVSPSCLCITVAHFEFIMSVNNNIETYFSVSSHIISFDCSIISLKNK